MFMEMVWVRVDEKVVEMASAPLKSIGMWVSDAVRIPLVRVAAMEAPPRDSRSAFIS
jgi:antitoxin component of RelBE/YafQ-DinJ toxin-antitoxin module